MRPRCLRACRCGEPVSPRSAFGCRRATHVLRIYAARGVDEAGGHRVHGDAARPVLQRKRLGEPVHRRLGRHVGRHERLSRMSARRGDVHDPAPPGLDHVGQHGLNAVEDAVEVDVDHPLPVLERDIGESLEPFEPGGVDQNRHRSQLCTDGVQRGVHRSAIRHVGGIGEIVVRRVEVERGDVQAIGAQPLSDGLADAGATTGHDGVLHVTAWRSTIKNRPSDYENRTLVYCDLARQSGKPIRTGETFGGCLSQP
jgi:hypothetical protein